jgi:hypothetical protein
LGPQRTLGNWGREVIWITLFFSVTLSGKKDSGKQRRRRKEKTDLPNDAENDDNSDNVLNEMDISELHDAANDDETGKVGGLFLFLLEGVFHDYSPVNFAYIIFY